MKPEDQIVDASGWTVRRNRAPQASGDVQSVAELCWAKAKQNPDRAACYFDDEPPVSYRDMAEETAALCGSLTRLGVGVGDTVSFQLPNWREAVIVNLAAAALGLVVNPISPIYRGAELRFILRDSRAKVVFIPAKYRSTDHSRLLEILRPELPELQHIIVVRGAATENSYEALIRDGRSHALKKLPHLNLDAVKMVMYTSGTTGPAKGVLHSHRTIAATHVDYRRLWEVCADDVMLMPSPVTHATGYVLGLEVPFYTDAPVAFMERWDPKHAITLINDLQATLCAGATVFLQDLVDTAEQFGDRIPSLRLFSCGGAAIPPEVIYRAAAATERCRAMRVYGSTEAPLVTKGWPEPADVGLAAETDGRISEFEVKIIDSAGQELPQGEPGEILVRGAPLMIGYTNPDDTEQAFDVEGYFKTGDIGFLTNDAALVITGRRKDLIIRGGENLSPKEIEDALLKHPAVKEAAVVAMPHPRLGEAVCAYIIVRAGAEAPSLLDLVELLEQEGLARQKFPERLEYVDSFPRTASGKIRKDILRDALKSALVIQHNT
ncbi:MAG TPA: AMP-binding protein [Steroidobacteraceae bacterium]|jgi:acyl-CoA synthetase|nr:AMP-binding protein [Steroidobacteraceae bacterium]